MASFSSLPELSINLTQDLLDKFLSNWEDLRQQEKTTGFIESLIGLCRNLLDSNLLAMDIFFEETERLHLPVTRSPQLSPGGLTGPDTDTDCSYLLTHDSGRFIPVYHSAMSRLGNQQKTRVRESSLTMRLKLI